MLSERGPSPLGEHQPTSDAAFAASRPEEAGRWAPLSHVTLSRDGGLKGGRENNPEISNPSLLLFFRRLWV